jgi:5-methyltetrahydropteroyltriglutamate--homocysteine methyltransferase
MIQTTVVGSYPVPTWLKAHPSPEAMRDAVRVVLQVQERAGIDVISDGELTRWNARDFRPSGMVERFVAQMDGVCNTPSSAQRAAYQSRPDIAYRGKPPAVVIGDLGPGQLDLELEWLSVAPLTSKPLKFTLTSPYMIAKLLHDERYGDLARLANRVASILADQVASIGAAIVQVDEPNLPGSPQDALIAADAINTVIAQVKTESAVHLCFGNFGGQRIQQGDYEHLVRFFNQLECNHLVLETTRQPIDQIRLLNDVKPEIAFGFGVIDVKDLQIEKPSQVASRIERLAELVGIQRIKYVHPDCGLSHLPRDVADGKLAALAQGRNLFAGSTR